MTLPLKRMIFQAADHACLDPDLNDYVRQNIVPYKQKHPPADKQYTLYFQRISVSEVYFMWVNDVSCLHDTRANYDDPCTKEFLRIRDRNLLELYDAKFHHPQFEVHPKSNLPIRCRSRFLGYEVSIASNKIGNGFEAYSFSYDDPHPNILNRHTHVFLEALHAHVKKVNIPFKITIFARGNEDTVVLLRTNYNRNQWNEVVVVGNEEDFILEAII